MRRLGVLDSVFVALETHDHPLHTMAVLVLDPATILGGYDFEQMRSSSRADCRAIPPLRRRLVTVPFGIGRPWWVETKVDVAAHVHGVQLDGGTLADVMRAAAALDEMPLDRSCIRRHASTRHETRFRSRYATSATASSRLDAKPSSPVGARS